MNKKLLVLLLVLLAFSLCLAACDRTENFDGQAKVTFDLQGGSYKSCQLPVVQYYNLPEGTSSKIAEMTALSGGAKDFMRGGGYEFDGWYRTKNDDGTYSGKWNFDADTISAGEELTLYARWYIPTKHTFAVYYIDESTNQEEQIGSIDAIEGKCSQQQLETMAQNARSGFQVVDFYDEDGNLWDSNNTHPGGDEDLAVKIRVEYIESYYTVIKSASDLNSYSSGDIYLARDVDMGGEKLDLTSFTTGTFKGNGHTISNFEVMWVANKGSLITDFDGQTVNVLNVAIFGKLNMATVSDVTFKNFFVDIDTTYGDINKIYVSPLAGDIKKSELTNVNAVDFEFKYSHLPAKFFDGDNELDTDIYIVVIDSLYYQKDDSTEVTNCKVEVKSNSSNDAVD